MRVLSTRVRGDWQRRQNRRGGLQTFWHAYNIPDNHWIARDHFTLASIKQLLVQLGYCASASTCVLRREKAQ